MKLIKPTTLLFIIFTFQFTATSQGLKINEFMASNSYVVADNYTQYEDWVELYNPTNEDIDIAGMWVTDNLDNPLKWQIPAGSPILTTVDAGGYLIIWFDKDSLQGPTHTNSGLKRKGEQIGIYDENLNVVDTLTYSEQEKNVSYGRFPDGADNWHFFNEPSPNSTNDNSTPYDGFVKGEPLFSIKRGFYDEPQSLVLSQTFTSGQIKYTVDGSKPNDLSATYTSPIGITNNTVVRAAVFQDNLIPSKIKTHSFYINYDLVGRKLPVISLSSDANTFWDNESGIFAQTEFVDWEYEVNIELFENDGDDKISSPMGVETFEQGVWEIPQKPLLFNGRDEYGKKNFNYRIFPKLNINSFRNFVFSNTENDWGYSLIRDYLAQEIAPKNYLDLQYKRPVSVFFDQDYLGLYSIDAPLDGRYFADQNGLNNDSIDVIFSNGAAVAGTPQQYFELQAVMQNTDYSNNTNYNQLLDEIDVASYIDYISTVLFCGNNEFAQQNTWMWKPQNQGKWHWILHGMDEAFDNENDQLMDFFTTDAGGLDNPDWSTLFFRKLLENDGFKQEFLAKYADHLYVTFHPNNTITKLNNAQELFASEMQYQISRWNGVSSPIPSVPSMNQWNDNINQIRNYLSDRPGVLLQDALDYFDEVSATSLLDLTVVDEGDGKVFLHNLFVTDGVWSGQYFNDVPITLTAIPAEGFTFVEWLGVTVDDATASTITFTMNGDLDIHAVFEPNPTYEFDVVINEIKYRNDTIADLGDWIELYNNSSEMIDLSGWKLDDGSNFFLFPDNYILQAGAYLIIASDQLRFIDFYNADENLVLGNLPFGFSNSGETLSLIDNHNEVKDLVDYNNSSPWPENVHTSIELIAPYLDNNQGKNWIESNQLIGSSLAINTADRLHLGNIPNQEINVGEIFEVIDLRQYVFSPNTSVEDLTWEASGNENINITFDDNSSTATLSYSDWQGVEKIAFTVTDNEGQTSSDTSLFFVGTIIDSPSICNQTFTDINSPYLVKNTLLIPSGCFLHVEDGTSIRFESEAEIICEGELEMIGSENQHIQLLAHQDSWKDIFIKQTNEVAKFAYCDISGATYGTDSVHQNAAISNYYSELEISNCYFDKNLRSVYSYHGKLLVDSCYFTETNFGEKVNAQFTDATTLNSYLEYTYGDNDAIDYDATDTGVIRNNIILGGGDDGVDIGQFEGVACNGVIVENNRIFNIFDKSVSVGEGSQNINIHHNLLFGSTYGVSVKDSSTAVVDHCTIDRTKYGVACFQKNIGLGGGIATVTNSIITHSTTRPILVDDISSITTTFSQTNDELITGEGNFVDEPYYQDSESRDYNLTIYSPAIDAGEVNFSLDADGSRTDMGAYPFDKSMANNPVSNDLLLYPNPANNQLTLAIQNGDQETTTIELFSVNGEIVINKIIEPNYSDLFQNDYYQMNVSGLSPGYYLIRITQSGNVVYGRVLVE